MNNRSLMRRAGGTIMSPGRRREKVMDYLSADEAGPGGAIDSYEILRERRRRRGGAQRTILSDKLGG